MISNEAASVIDQAITKAKEIILTWAEASQVELKGVYLHLHTIGDRDFWPEELVSIEWVNNKPGIFYISNPVTCFRQPVFCEIERAPTWAKLTFLQQYQRICAKYFKAIEYAWSGIGIYFYKDQEIEKIGRIVQEMREELRGDRKDDKK